MKKLDICMIGLSVMGRSLALNMADHGFLVGGYNRSREVTMKMSEEYGHTNIIPFYSLPEMIQALKRPRKIMLMIQAGKPVDEMIDQLILLLDKEDIILDCGNSFYEDTRRRYSMLEDKKIYYFGVGVSGGEAGARFGPSIMPGGNEKIYHEIQPILEAISAKAGSVPCCTYIGPDGAGHYVKMVHNGIEYADMQLIAESYLLLKQIGNYNNKELSDIFRKWNEGELHSYLIGITADILKEPDDFTHEGELIDYILDSAHQKGTGRWTSIESLKQGINVSMITDACNARVMSNKIKEREAAAQVIHSPKFQFHGDRDEFVKLVKEGLYAAKIAAYAQGFSLLQAASLKFGWDLNMGKIAAVFRAGCIIQAEFLNDITEAFKRNPCLDNLMLDEFFSSKINNYQEKLREAAALGITGGYPIPVMASAVTYLDAFRGTMAGANLIQGMRDYFGAHTFERTDRPGSFHHEWGKHNEI